MTVLTAGACTMSTPKVLSVTPQEIVIRDNQNVGASENLAAIHCGGQNLRPTKVASTDGVSTYRCGGATQQGKTGPSGAFDLSGDWRYDSLVISVEQNDRVTTAFWKEGMPACEAKMWFTGRIVSHRVIGKRWLCGKGPPKVRPLSISIEENGALLMVEGYRGGRATVLAFRRDIPVTPPDVRSPAPETAPAEAPAVPVAPVGSAPTPRAAPD